jgi:hypothetical protein
MQSVSCLSTNDVTAMPYEECTALPPEVRNNSIWDEREPETLVLNFHLNVMKKTQGKSLMSIRRKHAFKLRSITSLRLNSSKAVFVVET